MTKIYFTAQGHKYIDCHEGCTTESHWFDESDEQYETEEEARESDDAEYIRVRKYTVTTAVELI